MSKPSRISEAEWVLMEIIWRQYPITAAQLITTLSPTHDWAPNTIRTMLARLVKKGVLKTKSVSGAHLYSPRVDRSKCVQEEVDSLVDRVFDGSLFPLFLHFVKHRKLKPEELRELREILEPEEPQS